MNVKRSRIPLGLLGAVVVVAAILVAPMIATAQVPPTADLYGVHEIVVSRPLNFLPRNPFNGAELSLDATYRAPSGRVIAFWGFYDGDGAGNMFGTIWRIRFMPDEIGTWTVSWRFTDSGESGSGSFLVSDAAAIPGPPKLDPANNKLLVDARNNPIHWRGYGAKHVGQWLDSPLNPGDVDTFLQTVIDGPSGLRAGRYNVAYIAAPAGWKSVTDPNNGWCDPLKVNGTIAEQVDCPLWGNYTVYSLWASHEFDKIVSHLYRHRIYAIGWLMFGLQHSVPGGARDWGTLALRYPQLMRYFVARYGAYYNFFMWSPTWEVWEAATVNYFNAATGTVQPGNYVQVTNAMMSHLQALDPWKRLQGIHDQAQIDWLGWQRILPRQQAGAGNPPVPLRDIFAGNTRKTGIYAGPAGPGIPPIGADYPYALVGAEDLWEFCRGRDDHLGKPRDWREVQRGLVGELFASVLAVYDEWFTDNGGPCGGPGNGAADVRVSLLYDWWYANINYRHPQFQMLNQLRLGNTGEIISGIPGVQYVIYKQDGGLISIDLTGAAGVFAIWAKDAVTGADVFIGNFNGGGPLSAPSPFGANDTIVTLTKL